MLIERSSKINVKLPKKDVHAGMEVFYNPLMKSNRNISFLLLNSIGNKDMNIALPLAGSGIRGLRFLQELEEDKINHLFVNDKKENFSKTFTENLRLNKIRKTKVSIHNEEASLFLLNQVNDRKKPKNYCGYFDYIDIDPFGSPNPFISAAIARISRNGILAVTSTDTAALTGTYPKVTKRKYWSRNTKNFLMHELGLRILIRKVQLQGIQFEKALVPVLSYHKDHYFRVYFRSERGKTKCDEIIRQHKYFLLNPKTLGFRISEFNKEEGFEYFGPLWTGNLFDKSLLRKMVKNNPFPEEKKFLEILKNEKDIPGFYDLHVISKKYKLPTPKMGLMLEKLRATTTHFSKYGVKTEKDIKEIVSSMKNEKRSKKRR